MKINTIDIQTTYQTHILEGNYKDLLCFAPLKKLNSNDWAEYYGKEYDTDNPQLDTTSFSLSFISKSNQYDAFISFLSAQTYNDFHFEELNKSFRLRFVGVRKAKKEQGYITYEATFANDNPLQGYTYITPNDTLPPSGFTIDTIDLSKYGIYLLEENESNLLKSYEVKEHLTTNSSTIAGVQYAEYPNVFKERTLELLCYMKQPTDRFWKLYEALLYNISQRGERAINAFGSTFKAIYQKANVKEVLLTKDTLRMEFTIYLVVI